MLFFPRSSRLVACLLLLLGLFACKQAPPIVEPPAPDPDPQPQQYGTPFTQVPAISDIQMYEVNPRVFSPGQDLAGITARLDAIQALGINVVWLMPIYPTGRERSVGSPYAIRDYLSIHPDYGDLDDLRALVDRAHALGMAVILDWVANHTAWDHPWISKPGWHVTDANGRIIHPPGTNWQDVAELNYANPDMRREMIQAMKYWVLEANVDGFRCDFAGGAPVDFWEAAIDTLRSLPQRELILFAESGDKPLLNAGFDLIFGWPYYGQLKAVFDGAPARTLHPAHLNAYAGLAPGKHILRWVTNHDEHAWDATPQAIFGGHAATVAAFVLAAYQGGAPLVYNGQEVGVPTQLPFFEGHQVSIDWTQNPAIQAQYTALLQLRLAHEALRRGSLHDYSSDDLALFERRSAQDTVLVAVNVRPYALSQALPPSLAARRWQDAGTGTPALLDSVVELPAFGYGVWAGE